MKLSHEGVVIFSYPWPCSECVQRYRTQLPHHRPSSSRIAARAIPASDFHTDIMAQNLQPDEQSEQTPTQPPTMPPPAAIDDYSRPVTPDNANGLASPRTPRGTGLSLTEYTANPSPPSEDQKSKAQHAVPQAFLLPNGYPDVRGMRAVLPPDFALWIDHHCSLAACSICD